MRRLEPTGTLRSPSARAHRVAAVLIVTFAALDVAVVLLAPVPQSQRWLATGLVLVQAALLFLAPGRPLVIGVAIVALGGITLATVTQAGSGLAPAAVFTAAAFLPGRRSWPPAAIMVVLAPVGLVHGSQADVLLCLTAAVAAWSLGALLRSQRSRRVQALRSELRRQRSILARDVHDIVAHSLALIIVQAGAAEDGLDRDPAAARGALQAIDRSARSALDEVRRVVAGIAEHHDVAELSTVAESAEAAGMSCDLRVTGDPDAVPEEISDAIFRIVRESVTNSIKHSGGTTVRIDVECGPFTVDVQVADDGAGSDPPRPTGDGRGIIGMTELVERAGGSLHTGPERHGFVVRARLPVSVPRDRVHD